MSLFIIAGNLDVCVWRQNIPVQFTFTILLMYAEERSKLINRLKGLCFLWNRASSTLSYRSQNESMNKIIAKKVCWVVWFLFSLLNKKVDFQISVKVEEGNLHSELHMLCQALSAHNLCEQKTMFLCQSSPRSTTHPY